MAAMNSIRRFTSISPHRFHPGRLEAGIRGTHRERIVPKLLDGHAHDVVLDVGERQRGVCGQYECEDQDQPIGRA